MTDTPNPDWVAWLARAEAEQSGEADDEQPGHYIMTPGQVPGWKKLGDVAAKVVAGLTGGVVGLLVLGAVVFALRAL